MRMKDRIYCIVLCISFLFSTSLGAEESSPTDEIVIKATNAVIFEMNANLKLSQDQINAIQPIVADNIVKTRNLQQSLQDGNIDGSTMYSQRQQLTNDENSQLAAILTPDQMKVWINIQNQDPSNGNSRRSVSK